MLRFGLLVALAGAGPLCLGCAIPSPPTLGPPLQPGQFAPGGAWGTSYGPSRARVVGKDGTTREIRGNGDNVLGVQPGNISVVLPQLLELRAAVLPRLDLGVHLGWYGAGGGTRVRLTDPDAPHAFYLGVDGAVGYAVPRDDRTPNLSQLYSARLLAEAALRLRGPWQLLTALGLSAGYRRHGIDVGSVIAGSSIDRVIGAENTLAVGRAELRLEAGVGGYLGLQHGGLQIMVMPYLVLANGAPTAECLNCFGPATLHSFEQQWGFSLLIHLFGLSKRNSSVDTRGLQSP